MIGKMRKHELERIRTNGGARYLNTAFQQFMREAFRCLHHTNGGRCRNNNMLTLEKLTELKEKIMLVEEALREGENNERM